MWGGERLALRPTCRAYAVDRTCEHCGHINRLGASYCARCGGSQAVSPQRRRPLRAGQYLKGGAYQVQGPLSKGGMGAVYLARDVHAFGRPCVVKEILDYYDLADPQAQAKAEARFREEGRLLASLSHPGIPKIYAFFEEDSRYFIVMEYILGENLDSYVTRVDELGRVIPKKAIAEEDVLRYTIQACAILEYLADQPRPVVHQDVKPANLIRERIVGDVRLVDFGTAWTRRQPSTAHLGYQQSSVYGTMGYAAPEQCNGAAVPRSDVYALSATVYHLLTDDDPREHPGSFPGLAAMGADLGAALEQALRPDPDRRSSARQLREHLESILTPQRTLHAFAFPGGDRIRSIGGLPAMCDRHWQAARDYLYSGDFERWLRDLNRLDLVEVAKTIRTRNRNHDAGLEAFLRALDPGLARPRLVVEPAELDIGHVAREESITRELKLWNRQRGYAAASVTTRTPWIKIRPPAVGLLAQENPAIVSLSIRTRDLPLRGHHQGTVVVDAGDAGSVSLPVVARISFLRELWRDLQLAWQGAAPQAASGWHSSMRWLRKGKKRLDAATYGRIRWFVGGHLGGGAMLCLVWWLLTHAKDVGSYLLIFLAGLPALFVSLLAMISALSLAVGVLSGAAKGLWRTFS